MRAILIDPEKQTITEIDFKGDYRKIQKIIGCSNFTSGSRPLRGSTAAGFDTLYVSDDYLEDREDPRFWFQVDADRDPPSSHPIAGRGLVLGVDRKGAECSAKISVAELTPRITFTQRKFRGIETFTGDAARARGAHFVVELKAPIIDGTDETQKPQQKPPSWNAKMLGREPLITDEQFGRLLANAPKSLAEIEHHDPVPAVKIFLPHVRWLLCWIHPEDLDRAFGVVWLGDNQPEAGDVLLSDIVRTRLGPLAPERDKYIDLNRPFSHYLRDKSLW